MNKFLRSSRKIGIQSTISRSPSVKCNLHGMASEVCCHLACSITFMFRRTLKAEHFLVTFRPSTNQSFSHKRMLLSSIYIYLLSCLFTRHVGILVRQHFLYFIIFLFPFLYLFSQFSSLDRAGPFRTLQIVCHYCPAGRKVAAARPFSEKFFSCSRKEGEKIFLKILNWDAPAEHFHSMFLSFR